MTTSAFLGDYHILPTTAWCVRCSSIWMAQSTDKEKKYQSEYGRWYCYKGVLSKEEIILLFPIVLNICLFCGRRTFSLCRCVLWCGGFGAFLFFFSFQKRLRVFLWVTLASDNGLCQNPKVLWDHTSVTVVGGGTRAPSTPAACSDQCQTTLFWQGGDISFQPAMFLLLFTRCVYNYGNVNIKTHQR